MNDTMPTCEELLEFLAAYVAEELPADRRARFDDHLARCPDCRRYLQSYRRTVELGRDAGEPEPLPDELVRAILDSRD